MRSLLRLLQLLLLLFVVFCDSAEIEDRLFDDATVLKKELEAHAWTLMRRSQDLVKFGLQEDAEQSLREAVGAAPWLPEAYCALAHHLFEHGSRYRIQEMIELFNKAMRIHHALPKPTQGGTAADLMTSLHKRPSMLPHFKGQTFPCRLKHDREQLALLGERGRLPQSIVDRYVRGYDQLLALIPPDSWEYAMNLPESLWAKTIGSVYQRALYVPEVEPLKGRVLNPNLDFAKIEEQYLTSDPRFVYFDDLLTDEALLKLRHYYEEATVFWDAKPGYVGSYLLDGGFGNVIVAQLIEELVDAFPRLICTHQLSQAWAYKYDSEIARPIAPHADVAAINFNFWISPDEGNLDPDSGGLVVYKAIPPEGTPMSVFNQLPLHENVTKMLGATGYANHTVPYRSNRAVVFQSNLFHESGQTKNWAPGYTKRRINLTLLFGKMYGKCADDEDSQEESCKQR